MRIRLPTKKQTGVFLTGLAPRPDDIRALRRRSESSYRPIVCVSLEPQRTYSTEVTGQARPAISRFIAFLRAIILFHVTRLVRIPFLSVIVKKNFLRFAKSFLVNLMQNAVSVKNAPQNQLCGAQI
ncbi:MAG: hypothetical protein LUE06_10140 [Oscillospiraceae bacterium]|nr:hypothetical protein [Oscillospiraceae bacterium]